MKIFLLLFVFLIGCSTVDTAGTGRLDRDLNSSDIRYDNKLTVPHGFQTYCTKYPQRKECGGEE